MEGGRARLGSTLSSRPQPSKSFKAAAEHATGWAAPARPPARPWRGPLGGCGGPGGLGAPSAAGGGLGAPLGSPRAGGSRPRSPSPASPLGSLCFAPQSPSKGLFPPRPHWCWGR